VQDIKSVKKIIKKKKNEMAKVTTNTTPPKLRNLIHHY